MAWLSSRTARGPNSVTLSISDFLAVFLFRLSALSKTLHLIIFADSGVDHLELVLCKMVLDYEGITLTVHADMNL